MDQNEKKRIFEYLEKMTSMENEQIAKTVDKYLDDETIEEFVGHIEDFYGIDDDEQLGVLAQIMITGYVVARETSN